MENANAKPWPHSPAVIARVEDYTQRGIYQVCTQVGCDICEGPRVYWETTLDGQTLHASSHEGAVRNAEELKFWAERDRLVPPAALTLADELGA